MIPSTAALRERPELDCHMLLTVHDELVFEVAEGPSGGGRRLSIRERMERAVELDVDLRADVGSARTGRRRLPRVTDLRVSGDLSLTGAPARHYHP